MPDRLNIITNSNELFPQVRQKALQWRQVSAFERANHNNEHSSSPHNRNLAATEAFFADEGRISVRAESGTKIAIASDMDAPIESTGSLRR